jgi:hypothetical protein
MVNFTKPTPRHLYADEKWVETELIPLLDTAYGKRPTGVWKEFVRQATLQLDNLVRIRVPTAVPAVTMLTDS